MLSVDEALARVLAAVTPLAGESMPLAAASGRVLQAPVTASHSQPPFDASAMDGYAVRAEDVVPGTPLRLVGTAQAGQRFSGMVNPGQCVRIFTGAPLPIGTDSVVIQEEATADGNAISFAKAIPPGHFVRRRGSVFAEGATLLPAGLPLTPARLALAAAANRAEVTVTRRPRIAILSSGDELVRPGTPLGPDQIVSANNYGLAALFAGAGAGAEIVDLGIVADDLPALVDTLAAALDSGIDMLVTSGGASVGNRDFTQEALKALGVGLDFWQIALRPGKPMMFGKSGETLVFGLPGNPVSALVTATVFGLPALRRLNGQSDTAGLRLTLPLAAALPPNGERQHFLRGVFEPAPGGTRIMPLAETDSGHIASLAAADALIVQPEHDPGQPAGSMVDVIPLQLWA
ncbi:MAG TPA: gephyrin-like molybdotransferase Glp [Devosia sp.]|nr:gephyrin-like molybdotransferase Glp [Devosia sp.]